MSGYNPVFETEHYIDGQHNGGVYNSGNLNTYGYCYQNPVIYVDPNGKQIVSPTIAPPPVVVSSGNTTGVHSKNRLKGVTISGLYKEAKEYFIRVVKRTVIMTETGLEWAKELLTDDKIDTDTSSNSSSTLDSSTTTSTEASPEPNEPNKKGGGKNGQHANQKAKQSASEQYEQKKLELNKLRSKPNKTPEDKVNLRKLENQVKQLQQKKDYTGENHSRNAKGNRK